MNMIADVLLGAGVIFTLAGAIPAFLCRDILDRLHYTSVAAVVGVPLIAIAAMVEAGDPASCVKAAVVLVATVVLNALVSHALARAIYRRRTGEGGPP
jgi:monovalent cation/proton antiporter MnhG/PhaG subunit